MREKTKQEKKAECTKGRAKFLIFSQEYDKKYKKVIKFRLQSSRGVFVGTKLHYRFILPFKNLLLSPSGRKGWDAKKRN